MEEKHLKTKSPKSSPISLTTSFTRMMGAKYPIIAGPMFLVSDEKLVVSACEAGIVGGTPSLNWRSLDKLKAALTSIKSQVGDAPFAVNIIVNKSNIRRNQ